MNIPLKPMNRPLNRFPHNDIISLTSEQVTYDLAESIGPDLKLADLWNDAFVAELKQLDLAYGSAPGNDVLRGLIAELHGVDPDDVITTVGGMQVLFLLAFILCGDGAEAVIERPVFANAKSVLEAVGADIVELPAFFDDRYRIDIETLRSTLTARTRLICLATPKNPSGVAVSEDEVRSILRCMDETCPDAFLLLDETYRQASYGDDETQASFVTLDPRIVSCASLSKCHGVPGIRTGWAITQHPRLRDQLVLGKFNTTIASSLVDDALAIQVLRNGDRILADRRRHLAAGLEQTSSLVQQHAGLVEWIKPDAGALCCLRLRSDAFDDAAVARFYANLKGRDTRVGNGSWFGEQDRIFRVGFGFMTMPDLREALSRLSQALRAAA